MDQPASFHYDKMLEIIKLWRKDLLWILVLEAWSKIKCLHRFGPLIEEAYPGRANCLPYDPGRKGQSGIPYNTFWGHPTNDHWNCQEVLPPEILSPPSYFMLGTKTLTQRPVGEPSCRPQQPTLGFSLGWSKRIQICKEQMSELYVDKVTLI